MQQLILNEQALNLKREAKNWKGQLEDGTDVR